MAYEQRDNSGTVFENDRKESDNHPDYTGKAMVNGVMYWVSMWVKEKQDGEEFFSLALKPQDDQQPRQAPQRQQEAPQRQSRRVAPTGQAPQQRQQPRRTSSGFDDMPDDIPY